MLSRSHSSCLLSPPQLQLRHHAMSSIATIQIGINEPDNKVNSLGAICRSNILNSFKSHLSDPTISAIVLTGSKPGFFSGGADIKEFSAGEVNKPSLHDVINLIESSPKPTIAALNGLTLGGGLELALSCNYRLSTRSAKFGLPEVKLGIIPGAGGTQRLPRLTSVPFALDLTTSGRTVSPSEALAANLIDACCEKDQSISSLVEQFIAGRSGFGDIQSRNISLMDCKSDSDACDMVLKKLPKLGGESMRGCVQSVRNAFEMETFEEVSERFVSCFYVSH